jgi:hypothetical protein
MKKIYFLVVVIIIYTKPGYSQTMCKDAIQQLQAYAFQVNKIYYQEYNYIIPNQRCPAYWNGQLLAPLLVQNCRIEKFAYLNQWYSQQCTYVNNWYNNIISSCAVDDRYINDQPVIDDKIEPEKIEELIAGVDEKKTVMIKIPKTAAGYKPNLN